MRPSDIARLEIPSSLTLAPDGRSVVFALKTVDMEEDSYVSRLWRVPTDGATPPVRLTHGDNDSDPRFSPDGRWIAFRRSVERKPQQLWLMPADGGEPRPVTTAEQHPIGAGAPVWRPGSDRLAYVARVPEQGRYGTGLKGGLDKDRGPGKELPRRVTTLHYRLDGIGYTNDRRPHVFTVDPFADSPEPKQLTDGDFDHASVAWSPDGATLAFTSSRHETRNSDRFVDVFVLPEAGGEPRRLTATSLWCGFVVFGADGSSVYFTARETGDRGLDWFAEHDGLWVVPVDGSAPAVRLSDPEVYTVEEHLGPGRTGVLYANQHRGEVQLLEFPPGGGEPEVVIGGQRQVRTADAAGDTIAAIVSTPDSWGEIVVADGSGERTLTGYGKDWQAFPMREIEATAPDGERIHGWVVRPDGVGPHPVLLMIHGGPFTQYGWTMFDEAQVYAGAGYAVVYGNPRGSSGYGSRFGRYIAGDVGARSAPDLLALLDRALEDPALDPARLGVLGGSHGGFMTSWLAAHEPRFKAAVSERSLNAIDSFLGTSDVGWVFGSLYGDDPEGQRRQSPLTYASGVTAPMLIIHSEEDWRCPVEQAQRFFHALKTRGVPVEMLLFPGEGHEMSRSGLPSHRVARFEAILEWFARYV